MIHSRKFDQLIKTTLGDAQQRWKDKLIHRQGWQKDKYCASPANKKCDFKFCAYNSGTIYPGTNKAVIMPMQTLSSA